MLKRERWCDVVAAVFSSQVCFDTAVIERKVGEGGEKSMAGTMDVKVVIVTHRRMLGGRDLTRPGTDELAVSYFLRCPKREDCGVKCALSLRAK